MLQRFLILLAMLSSQAHAKEIKAKKASSFDGYLFLESAIQDNRLHLSIVGKTETKVIQRIERTTNAGPVVFWAINTQWKDDIAGFRAALDKAIAEHPEWKDALVDTEEIGSAFCKFKLTDPDILVEKGDRDDHYIYSNGLLCTYIVRTRNSADEKLTLAIKNNSAIDSGLGIVKVQLKSPPKLLFDAQNISEYLQKLVSDQSKTYSEKEAAFFLGASFANYYKDSPIEQENVFVPAHQKDLMTGLQLVFPKLFESDPSTANAYKWKPIISPTPISVETPETLNFDPQSKE